MRLTVPPLHVATVSNAPGRRRRRKSAGFRSAALPCGGGTNVYGDVVSEEASSTGPVAGGRRYDPEIVARDAMSKDPGLSAGLALRLAREAGQILATAPNCEAPDLSRQLLAGSPETGATPANCVATAAVAHCREAGQSPI